jgi:uncharacterized protein (TIGR03435 family)
MRAAFAIGLFVATASVASAQDVPSAETGLVPAFEVASVRTSANRGSTSYSFRWLPGGRFRAVNVSLRMLVNLAYDLRSDEQLIGAPEWIASERFDVEANPAAPVDQQRERLMMLQSLLRDRFGLVMRPQPVDVPVYALVRTEPGTPLPQTMRETAPCPRVPRDPLSATVPIEPPPSERTCSVGLNRSGRIAGRAASIAGLITMLRQVVDRRIIDRTGLTGRYDFEVAWVPDTGSPGGPAIVNAGIFSATQDLGLRLQPILAPADGYVVERIERPTPN